MPQTTRRRARAIAALLTAIVAGVGLPSAAGAVEPTGSIEATVALWETGDDAVGGCVAAYTGEDAETAVATVCEPADGAYVIEGLAPGAYRLEYTGFTDAPDQWSTWEDAHADADSFDVVGGAATVVAVELLPYGATTGTVLASDGTPAAGATVQRYYWHSSPKPLREEVTVGTDGRYVIRDWSIAESGSALLRFVPAADGQASVTSTQIARVPTELRTGVDAQFAPDSAIRGTIVAPDTVVGERACVRAFMSVGPGAGTYIVEGEACGDIGDEFTIDGLPEATYALCVTAESADPVCGYWEGWWGLSTHTGLTDSVQVATTTGTATEVDIRFGGLFTVDVTSEGEPVTDGCVALKSGSEEVARDCDGADGYVLDVRRDLKSNSHLRFTGFSTANDTTQMSFVTIDQGRDVARAYEIGAYGTVAGAIDYTAVPGATSACVDVHVGDEVFATGCTAPGEPGYSVPVPDTGARLLFRAVGADAWLWSGSDAYPISAATGEVRTIDLDLRAAGAVSVALAGPGGLPAAGGCLVAYTDEWVEAGRDCAGDGGTYRVPMYDGRFALAFLGFDGAPDQYWGGLVRGDAETTWVAAGETVAIAYTLSDGTGLRGHVLARGGVVTGGCVTAYADSGALAAESCVGADERFHLEIVEPGAYWLRFAGFDGAVEGYFGDDGAGSPVVFEGGTAEADFVLDLGATITGTVWGGGTTATLYSWAGEPLGTTAVESGAYSFEGVPEGEYKVLVSGGTDTGPRWATYGEVIGNHAPGRFVVSESTPVTLTAGRVPLEYMAPLYVSAAGKAEWDDRWLCIAAYRADRFESESTSTPVVVDCGDPELVRILPNLQDGRAYLLRVVPEELTVDTDWTSYTGPDYWLGNADGPWSGKARVISVGEDMSGYWLGMAYYTDVNGGSKAFSEISWLGGTHIASGYSDGTFRPRESVTRRNLAKLLYRYAGRPDVDLPEESPFADVSPSDGGYRAMVWLYQAGIASGFDDGSFRPNDEVSRRNLAKFLYRFAGRPEFEVPARSPYKDLTPRSGGYRAMAWMAETGIASGFSDGTFRPEQDVIRRQIATFLYRYTLG
ncbi:S-layer homology domain-containing protein [Demequina rhizosphaerae]|uniref:S-layer homology domain-containing protein n=1 Tax=Demequina rhizosphaerae TaxID=1638985 RepID=UPI0007838F90|nr:S-layer homology domain-containing protein [Demequina rhizosphaerae]